MAQPAELRGVLRAADRGVDRVDDMWAGAVCRRPVSGGSVITLENAMAEIAYVKIHPAIGIARVGNSSSKFFYGPESPDEPPKAPGFSKDGSATVKRQAARFRVYSYDQNGNVLGEVKHGSDSATVTWTARLANKKASWYKFSLALDIPDAQSLPEAQFARRNAGITARSKLKNTPPPQSVSGLNQSGKTFDTGTINGIAVYLGELRTDEAGRLVVLGGKGHCASFTSPKTALTTFGNNEGWYDDISDGPVTAKVKIGDKTFEAKPAWVVVAPPNYAPDVKGIVTLYDLLYDLFVRKGDLPFPTRVTFDEHIKPLLLRLTGHQWVNEGFAAEFGWRAPNDFSSPQVLATLGSSKRQYRGLRQRVYYYMRNYQRDGMSPLPWPWLYGDAMASRPKSPLQHGVLTQTQEKMLELWVDGKFDDTRLSTPQPELSEAPLALQPGLLDRAALEYCLADAFHPGCEVTWPIRHRTLYQEPFRILHRTDVNDQDRDPFLTPAKALAMDGPLYAQGPGDLTRWMGIPWQTDTASCRSGYELVANIGPRYSPYLPSFWPARVPNQVLKEEDFNIVNDTTATDDQREQAFARRAVWHRFLNPDKLKGLQNMVDWWARFGIVETHPYTAGDGKFPDRVLAESTPDFTLPKVNDRRNLVNVHVPEAGPAATGEAQRTDANRQAVEEVVQKTEFDPAEISAGYIANVDPLRDSE
ncbi:LodA/GoxA family CTQ-dependent oxidase [Streptomyces albipurpureus]|uniref:LodA/GoxA family CTQ-dependent oxidase n=1 Tax=Streptomyces albipurpureus TaxID=2897419 RepID=A0ABT0UE29_9ACTN|nr:LodA/GoxA family CTQ-dependent oxidase [Streptomyces sp. CWNU-1]MCM2386728.1 LodA/GoxA family CTQ-dependent oxidase [Streptomyces sp. CWNU-1]